MRHPRYIPTRRPGPGVVAVTRVGRLEPYRFAGFTLGPSSDLIVLGGGCARVFRPPFRPLSPLRSDSGADKKVAPSSANLWRRVTTVHLVSSAP